MSTTRKKYLPSDIRDKIPNVLAGNIAYFQKESLIINFYLSDFFQSNGNIVIIAVENGSYATDKETNQYEHSVSENANRSICHTFSTWTCNWRNANEREKAKCLDRVSRFVFPLIFISFNVFYWIYFSKQRRELDV